MAESLLEEFLDSTFFDALFTIVVVAIGFYLFKWLFTSGKSHKQLAKEASDKINASVAKNAGAGGSPAKVYTKEEVAKHNISTDLWLIIDDKVYDFTAYIDRHPGGEAIFNNAGGDSSIGFKGEQHPERVWEMIKEYYIGELGDATEAAAVPVKEEIAKKDQG